MRLAVAAAAVSLGVIAPGDHATAAYVPGTLSLTLRYEMVCGQAGRGPLVVDLPGAFRVASRPRVEIRGAVRPASVSGSTVTILLPKPPHVTCMSITEGTLRIAIAGVRAPPGTYVVHARVNAHAFAASVRVVG
jgi:hypothetical protein